MRNKCNGLFCSKNYQCEANKRYRIPNGQSQMDIPEKLSTYDKEKQTKTTTQYVLDTTMCKQTQITYIRGGICYKKNGGKDEPNIVLCGNRNGHHNMELGNFGNTF